MVEADQIVSVERERVNISGGYPISDFPASALFCFGISVEIEFTFGHEWKY